MNDDLNMAKVCGMEGCRRVPEVYCECKTNNYYCLQHFLIHIKRIGKNHVSAALFIAVDQSLKEKLIKGINSKWQLLEKAKIEMKKRCSEKLNLLSKNIKVWLKK